MKRSVCMVLTVLLVFSAGVFGCATTRPNGTAPSIDLEAVGAVLAIAAANAPWMAVLYGQHLALVAELETAQSAAEWQSTMNAIEQFVDILVDLGVIPDGLQIQLE